MSGDPEFGRKIRAALRLPSDAPAATVLAAVDVDNARECARLGLSAGTPPAQVRAVRRSVTAARAEAVAMFQAAAGPAPDPQAAEDAQFDAHFSRPAGAR